MINAWVVAVALTGMVDVASAQTSELHCPLRPNSALTRILYLFKVGQSETYATCIYADGTDQSLTLRQGCRLDPVDSIHEAPPVGGMMECLEKSANRCRITCAAP